MLVRELAVLGYGLIALYTCVFGSLLAIFVPQLCDGPGFVMGPNSTAVLTTVRLECTLEQNVYIDIDPLNAVALGLNFLTCIFLIGGFAFEFYRERFLCQNFDVDYAQPDNNLEVDLAKYDELRDELHRWNQSYHDIFVVILLVATVNVIVSGILVFSPQFYQGYRGITTFATNVIFLATRLSNTVFLSQTSATTVRAISVNLAEPLQFNTVFGIVRSDAGTGHVGPRMSRRDLGKSSRSLTRDTNVVPMLRHLDLLGMPGSLPSRYGRGTGV